MTCRLKSHRALKGTVTEGLCVDSNMSPVTTSTLKATSSSLNATTPGIVKDLLLLLIYPLFVL